MTVTSNALVMYAKTPEPGQVKTRLTKGKNSLSTDEATSLYKAMLTDLVNQFSKGSTYDFFICPKGKTQKLRKEIKGDYVLLEDQGQGELGDSIYKSFKWLIEKDYANVCIINSDSPFLTTELVNKAFEALDNGNSLVIGPDHNGGCYLIGANQPYPIFCDIPWSQGKDFSIIKERVEQNNIPLFVLPTTQDLDIVKDLITTYNIMTENPKSFKQRMPQTYKCIKMFHVKHPNFF